MYSDFDLLSSIVKTPTLDLCHGVSVFSHMDECTSRSYLKTTSLTAYG